MSKELAAERKLTQTKKRSMGDSESAKANATLRFMQVYTYVSLLLSDEQHYKT